MPLIVILAIMNYPFRKRSCFSRKVDDNHLIEMSWRSTNSELYFKIEFLRLQVSSKAL